MPHIAGREGITKILMKVYDETGRKVAVSEAVSDLLPDDAAEYIKVACAQLEARLESRH